MAVPEHIAVRMDALRRALQDPDEQVRANASKALERLEAVADIDSLVEQFKNGDHLHKIRTIYAFGRIRNDIALKALVYALRSENEEQRTAAVRALGEAKDAKTLGPILEAFREADENTQVEILGVLPEFRDSDLVSFVRESLKSKNVEVVDAAIQALGRLGSSQSEPALLLILEKGPTRLRRSAAAALGQIEI